MWLLTASIMLLLLALVACKQSDNLTNTPQPPNTSASTRESNRSCINLNTATAEELAELPGIGEVMSRRIIEYRERHGQFRRPQDVIIIEGFSERKYRAISQLVCVE
jgi:competence protein ComEA